MVNATDDEQRLKTLYEAASLAYHEIERENVHRVLAGSRLGVEELQREAEAQERLASARRAYLDFLNRTA